MNDKELFKQKKQAQLDKWSAEIDELKAKGAKLGADAQLEFYKQIDNLKDSMKEGKKKLAKLDEVGEDKWESLKHTVESGWDSLKATFNDIVAKFKD